MDTSAQDDSGKRQMTGAEMVIQAMIDNGVTDIFGYPGGAVLPIYDELHQRSNRRMGKVLDRSILAMFLIYLLMGLAGYFSTFEKTTKIVIIRELANKSFPDWLAV